MAKAKKARPSVDVGGNGNGNEPRIVNADHCRQAIETRYHGIEQVEGAARVPSQAELDAVEHTYRMKLPTGVAARVSESREAGHRLVSQGCALFRCVLCGRVAFCEGQSSFGRARCVGRPAVWFRGMR